MPRVKPIALEYITALDRLPEEERLSRHIRETLSDIACYYGFDPIATSILEGPRPYAPLVKAGLMTLRTAVTCRGDDGVETLLRLSYPLSVLRAYMVHKMVDLVHPLKFFFSGESFTAEKGGHSVDIVGRSEWGLVTIGEEGPVAEAGSMQVVWRGLEALGMGADQLELVVNATGCSACRSSFRSSLMSYVRSRSARLCRNCRKYLKRIPTKIFSCPEEKCQMVAAHAPQVLDFLCDPCKKHLRGFLEFLDEVKIPYFLDSKFFRDDSYFSHLVFSLRGKAPVVLDTESATAGTAERSVPWTILGEGGRLSRAGELLTGKHLDAVGVVLFVGSLGKVMKVRGPEESGGKVFLAHLGELAKRKSLGLLEILRAHQVGVVESLGKDSIKSQLKIAERVGAPFALIMGQKEALDGTIIVREVNSGIQETVPQEKLIEFLKRKLAK